MEKEFPDRKFYSGEVTPEQDSNSFPEFPFYDGFISET